MILYDYLFPLIIVIIILGCLIYFRNSRLSIKEDFVNIDLSETPTRIYGNLFSGYDTRSASDAAIEEVNELISENPEKFKHLNTRKPNIYINGVDNTIVNTIALGNRRVVTYNLAASNPWNFQDEQDEQEEFNAIYTPGTATDYWDFQEDRDPAGKIHYWKQRIDNPLSWDVWLDEPTGQDPMESKRVKRGVVLDHTDGTLKSENMVYTTAVTPVAQVNNIITKENLDKFNKNIHKIPEFRHGALSRTGEPVITATEPVITATEPVVYYNNDSGPTSQNKLCIKRGDDTKCIEPRHLDMINGNMLIQFKIHDGATDTPPEGAAIESYNLEYGERDGFENVVQRTFYMKPSEHGRIYNELTTLSTCFGGRDRGRERHIITNPHGKAREWNGKFYINPQDTNNTNYSHIHSHKHE